MTRQRKFQIQQVRNGLCVKFAKPLFDATYCLKHSVQARNRQAKSRGAKVKYNCASRRAEMELKSK